MSIRSFRYGFVFAVVLLVAAVLAPGSARAQGMTLDICPTDYGSFPEDAPPLTCGCSAEAVKEGSVRGANPYQDQSSLCMAALHAGAIGAEGGQITVEPAPAPFFPAVTRNGVEGGSWGKSMGFRVVVSGAPAAPAAAAGVGGTASPQAAGMTLDICPTDYGSFPEDAPPLTCGCSAEAVKEGSVRGANPYQDQSSLCMAAQHAGAIGAQGGQITVEPAPAPFFPAVTRNGVEGGSWGKSMGFRVVVSGGAAAPAAAAGAAGTASPQAAGMALDICPTDYGSFPEDAPPLTCGCSAEAVKEGSVRGANPYQDQSSLCMAALHAGAIGAGGGQITVEPAPQPFFPAVTRNAVESGSWGKSMGFRVAVGGQSASSQFDAANAAGLTLDVCPTDYGSFPEDAPPLTCGCSSEAVKEGSLRGANPYQDQSSICRAALHAGAAGGTGGRIMVTPEPAAVFPAVTRNGVEGGSWGKSMGFRVAVAPGGQPVAAAAPEPAVDAAGKPVQAPIAETLKATGRVQLYVNFATDQDKPLPSSEAVLQELLATLQADEALRILLIGHTDSQGSAPYNLDLSQRRAAAVYLWLIQHGVDSGRLRSDGRGLMEPIADNATDAGRALNRRVEAKTMN